MTIDERIGCLRERAIYLRSLKGYSILDNPTTLEKQVEKYRKEADEYDELANWLKELKWYREQDLILRENAIETLTQMQWHDEEGYPVEDYEDKKQYAIDWVEQMPKAEPPKE